MIVLVLNCGSSSVKYQLYDMPEERCLAKGAIEKIRQGVKVPDHKTAVKKVIHAITNGYKIDAIGHRVVHGGERFKQSRLINKEVLKTIKQYSRFAPLHNPPNLAGIYAAQSLLPHLRQAAVFDTAFYQQMPACAYLYGLPYSSYKQDRIRRYGFHGTSHRYVAEQASRLLGRAPNSLKVISCHLGNGCSITAVDRGKAIDTSMGFTPLEGLVMGTRCGDVDPAAVFYLMKKRRLSISKTVELLNKSSGLLGLSGASNDMRDILRLVRRGNQRAKLALEVFVYRVKKCIGAYIAAMNGCNALVFTAGIGENQPYIRSKIRQGLSALIKKFNMRILVIPANEELMIARDTYRLARKRR